MDKRFTITQDFEEHHRQIRDNGHIIMGCFLEPQAEPIVKLLNELSEENEQLKKENYELHKRLGDFEPFERYMKERTSKTSVNDIIGLVKTDEQTNSVQLKKEAQLSICEKRLIELEKENDQLKSTLAYRSNQLALMEHLIDDLGSEEMKRQMGEILND